MSFKKALRVPLGLTSLLMASALSHPALAGKEPVVLPDSSSVVGSLGMASDDPGGVLQNDPVGTGKYATSAYKLLSGIKNARLVPGVSTDCVAMSLDQLDVLVDAVSATGDDVKPAIQRLADQLGAELSGVGLQVSRLDMSRPSYDSAVTSANSFINGLSDPELELAARSPTFLAVLALLRNDTGAGCGGSADTLDSDLERRNLDEQVAIIKVATL